MIAPYKHLGMWVFDDEKVGPKEEPFVGGADEIMDLAASEIPEAEAGFRLIFSANPFPGYRIHFEWKRPEMSGNVYLSEALGKEGWLSSALLKYFEEPPAELYTKFESLKH